MSRPTKFEEEYVARTEVWDMIYEVTRPLSSIEFYEKTLGGKEVTMYVKDFLKMLLERIKSLEESIPK